MPKGAGSGDKLARGAVSAKFMTTEGGVTDKKWNDIFDGYDPEEFKNAPNKSMQRREEVSGGDANSASSGVPGANVKEPSLSSDSD